MLRSAFYLIATATVVSPVGLRPAAAQVTHTIALSAGRAFMLDVDDPDPAGSYSVTGSFERRQTGRALSLGVEAGLHEYLTLRQDLPPDIAGWSSKLEDTRRAWRFTPFLRLGTRAPHVRVYAQAGIGLYVEHLSYFDQQREDGELVVDTQHSSTEPYGGLHLGLGLELAPAKGPIGLTLGFRSHAVFGGGDGFNNGEVGAVYRWGKGSR